MEAGRGDAAAATRRFRGGGVAATPRPGYSAEATPRLPLVGETKTAPADEQHRHAGVVLLKETAKPGDLRSAGGTRSHARPRDWRRDRAAARLWSSSTRRSGIDRASSTSSAPATFNRFFRSSRRVDAFAGGRARATRAVEHGRAAAAPPRPVPGPRGRGPLAASSFRVRGRRFRAPAPRRRARASPPRVRASPPIPESRSSRPRRARPTLRGWSGRSYRQP